MRGVLEDGTYDVVVVDAALADDAGPAAGVRVELTVLAGAHKGEVVVVSATGLRRDPLDLLATPGTLVVEGGAPRLVLEG